MLNKTPQSDNKNKGFTLLELLVAIFVITVGIIAAFIIAQYPLYYASISISRLTAAYLAQEGIEIVRNIRDTNWLQEGDDWNAGLGGGDYEADYTTTTFVATANDFCEDSYNCNNYNPDNPLKISGGFYCYTGAADTKFKRKITITPIDTEVPIGETDYLKVTVTVEWEEKGKPYTFPPVQENLYNWGEQLVPPAS